MRLAMTRLRMASSTSPLAVASAANVGGAAALRVGSGAVGIASAVIGAARLAAPASDAAARKPRRPMIGEARRFDLFDIGLTPKEQAMNAGEWRSWRRASVSAAARR